MLQIPNGVQEPSMDELLASIREIIEENTAISATEEKTQTVQHGDHSLSIDQDTSDVIGPMHNPEGVSAVEEDDFDALAERIGLRKAQAVSNYSSITGDDPLMASSSLSEIPVTSLPRPVMSGMAEASEIEMMSNVVKSQMQKSKEKVNDEEIGKPISADVERSVELLLRPYIAQWLDDHFRQLFEKILREEVQRAVQSLR